MGVASCKVSKRLLVAADYNRVFPMNNRARGREKFK
jgi:hypothetical protein